jgi:hypothetical protein
MIHANIAESGVFFGVLALTLLLLLFLYAVITADPQEAARTEATLIPAPALAPSPLPVRGSRTLTPRAFPGEAGRLAGPGYAAPHAAAVSVTSAGSVASLPQVSGDSQRGAAAALLFLIAGLALAVIGGGMFFGAGKDVTVCSKQVLAVCSDGFVVFHAAQVLGGAIAVGGVALVSTAIVLALR